MEFKFEYKNKINLGNKSNKNVDLKTNNNYS